MCLKTVEKLLFWEGECLDVPFWSNLNASPVKSLPFLLHFQHSEEMYDPEIYRHPISEYYNPYVLDAEIQAGEFNSNSAGFQPAP